MENETTEFRIEKLEIEKKRKDARGVEVKIN